MFFLLIQPQIQKTREHTSFHVGTRYMPVTYIKSIGTI